jgi:hypothetical protein
MRKVIYVLSHGTQWKMKCEHCGVEEITSTQVEAIRWAKRHAGNLPAGTLSQILVQGDAGRWRTEWTYGSDPFPPRG